MADSKNVAVYHHATIRRHMRDLHILVAFWLMLFHALAFADCVDLVNGQLITIRAQSCEAIQGDTNPEVQKHVGAMYETWNLRNAYTGALVRDDHGRTWMYPSKEPKPCGQFPPGEPVQKRAYFTCCDTGRWGKCVFGGQFLGELDAPPINTFQ